MPVFNNLMSLIRLSSDRSKALPLSISMRASKVLYPGKFGSDPPRLVSLRSTIIIEHADCQTHIKALFPATLALCMFFSGYGSPARVARSDSSLSLSCRFGIQETSLRRNYCNNLVLSATVALIHLTRLFSVLLIRHKPTKIYTPPAPPHRQPTSRPSMSDYT